MKKWRAAIGEAPNNGDEKLRFAADRHTPRPQLGRWTRPQRQKEKRRWRGPNTPPARRARQGDIRTPLLTLCPENALIFEGFIIPGLWYNRVTSHDCTKI